MGRYYNQWFMINPWWYWPLSRLSEIPGRVLGGHAFSITGHNTTPVIVFPFLKASHFLRLALAESRYCLLLASRTFLLSYHSSTTALPIHHSIAAAMLTIRHVWFASQMTLSRKSWRTLAISGRPSDVLFRLPLGSSPSLASMQFHTQTSQIYRALSDIAGRRYIGLLLLEYAFTTFQNTVPLYSSEPKTRICLYIYNMF